MEYKDYYQVLGVPRNADEKEIKIVFVFVPSVQSYEDPEFRDSFQMVEKLSQAAGSTVAETNLDTLDYYWDRAKELEVVGHNSGNAADPSPGLPGS